MKKNIGVFHCIAECETCGATFQNYKNAQALAARHAEIYGHRVTGEIALGFVYDGSTPSETEKRPSKKTVT